MSDGDPGPRLPPCLAALGMRRTCWQPGRSGLRWQVPSEQRLRNTAGHLHGGYLCVMADSLLGSSFSTTLGADETAVTLDFHAQFLERVELGARLEGEGRAVHSGQRLGFMEASILDLGSGLEVLRAHCAGLRRRRRSDSSSARTTASTAPPAPCPPATPEAPPLVSFTLPPWLEQFGASYHPSGDGAGRLVWQIAGDRFDNRSGAVQGGYLAYVADATMGFALLTGIAGAEAMSTTSLSLQLFRPAFSGMTLAVDARAPRRGHRFGFMACEITSGDELLARGWASGLIRRRSGYDRTTPDGGVG